MKAHFIKQLEDEANSIPIFLPADALLYLHSMYRKHFEELLNVPNFFKENVYQLIIGNDKMPDVKIVNKLFEKILSPSLREIDVINLRDLTNDIGRKLRRHKYKT